MSINSVEIKNLREQRAASHAAAITVLSKGNLITSEDKLVYERSMQEVDTLGNRIAIAEGMARHEANPGAQYIRENAAAQTPQEHMRMASFRKFMQFGKDSLEAQDRMLLTRESRAVAEGAPMLSHIGSYSGLGYFVPTGFRNQIEEATKWFAPLLEDGVFTILSTETGNPIPMPVNNDTGNSAVIVGEAASVNEIDTTASQINIAAYKFTSGEIIASLELIQDSAFDLDSWFAKKFGERFGRGLENYLTNGTGSNQPAS
jgi:HK97 family phage major capsid protein